VIGKIRLITYGTLEIGDVPRFALIENATPNDITNKPATKSRYLLKYSVFINAFQPFKIYYPDERHKLSPLLRGRFGIFQIQIIMIFIVFISQFLTQSQKDIVLNISANLKVGHSQIISCIYIFIHY